MTDDLLDDPDFIEWADRVRVHMLPKLAGSAMTISLVPTEASKLDVKFAVELGFSIMLDKPIIAIVTPGAEVPDRLRRVVDHVLEVDLDDPAAADAIMRAIESLNTEEGSN